MHLIPNSAGATSSAVKGFGRRMCGWAALVRLSLRLRRIGAEVLMQSAHHLLSGGKGRGLYSFHNLLFITSDTQTQITEVCLLRVHS